MADPITLTALGTLASQATAASAGTYAAAQAGVAGLQAITGMVSANRNAKAASEAEHKNYELLLEDLSRQQSEADIQEQEARSDRVLQANQELAQARMIAGDNGASASTRTAMIRHIAMMEGLDLGRIERTSQSRQDSLNSQRRAGATGVRQNLNAIENSRKTQNTNSILGGIGSGLQIGSSYYAQEATLEKAKNKETK